MKDVFVFFLYRVTEVMGYQPQELLGQLCFDLFHPEDLKHMTESFEQGKENCALKVLVL